MADGEQLQSYFPFLDLDRICRSPISKSSSLQTMAPRLTEKQPGKVIPDYILDNCAKHPNKIFLTQPMGGDVIQNWTFAEFLSESKKMASHIDSLKLPVPSQIAIMSKNCAWWLIADLAIMMTGHVSVPVYPTLTAETTRYTLEHSEAKLLFVGKLDEKPWKEMKNGIPDDMKCIAFPMCPEGVTYDKWADCVKGKEMKEVKKRTEEEMATIIYTSGSTGVYVASSTFDSMCVSRTNLTLTSNSVPNMSLS